MQKWEYVYLQINGVNQVIAINGSKTGSQGFFASRSANLIWDVLGQLGQQGWEVAGFTMSKVGEYGSPRVILKRPIETTSS
jgi:hypothetical protein